ncbi:hypothetical protein [Pandoraea sp. NPDC090278]|uniref:hypothetical protein n=1 Tax=Pandoraea sp. NPDC090278 TaxID=3364391 RepID=UPI003839E239
MLNISATHGHNLTVSSAPDQSHRDSAIDRLEEFTRRFKDDNCPADQVIDDFMRNFNSTELLGPVLRGLLEEKKEAVLRAAARCHVASFGRGREFLAKHNQLHLADEDSAALFGALPAESRAAMIADARVGDRGQIVFPLLDIGLCIPLGRTSLGTGDGALTMHEIRQLLMDHEGQCHWLLEIFAARLAGLGPHAPDTETCHVWSDLVDQFIDRKPIAEFSKERRVLEALASTLAKLTDRIDTRGRSQEFPMVRMLTRCAEAYFLVEDHQSCGSTLLELAATHVRNLERDAAVNATRLAASVFARNALVRWEGGRYTEAEVSEHMAVGAYLAEAAVRQEVAVNAFLRVALGRGVSGMPPGPTSAADDEIVPLPELVEHISQSDFKVGWAGRRAKTVDMDSQLMFDLSTLAIVNRLGKLRGQQFGSGSLN